MVMEDRRKDHRQRLAETRHCWNGLASMAAIEAEHMIVDKISVETRDFMS
jgi:hypothetical protein